VFDELAKECLPVLYAEMQERETPLVLSSSAWFMALFVGFLPFEVPSPLPHFSPSVFIRLVS
jgi:hypothetical protein